MAQNSAIDDLGASVAASLIAVRGAGSAGDPLRWAIDHLAHIARQRGAALGEMDSGDPEAILHLEHDPERPADAFDFQSSGITTTITGDSRGLVYGVLEIADRIACGADPVSVIGQAGAESNAPVAPLRGLVRYFTNQELDYPWFVDESFWPGFLTELATHRFGRFSLAFGLGQDYGHDRGVTDNYLSFVYPFLLDVPGFDVRARGVDAAERKRNLDALGYIARETVRRGLRFNLSLWAQNYTFPESPDLSHPIEGLDRDNWPAYSGRALRMLVEQIPEISGLTLRIHYEGGVPDNDRHRFWSAVLDEMHQSSRSVALDIHSKGADDATVDLFLRSGMPLTVSTKFAGEHLTLPYHAASIRPQERVPADVDGDMSITRGARIFTRYSYGDFMSRDRRYDIATRVWNGTQRFLLWADPLFAEAMGREAGFNGTRGLEVFDPLSLRGRWDTAGSAPRTAYTDSSLEPERDWHKYRPFYRAWGRGQYGGAGLKAAWQRYLRHEHGEPGIALGEAIAAASRILPLVMSVHAPGAGNRDYWPELYEDVPYLDDGSSDRMGLVSPLDPEMFYCIAEYARDEREGQVDARYRPTEIAEWFDNLSDEVDRNLAAAGEPTDPPARRLAIDAAIQAGMGRFFAAKYRAALHYERFLLDRAAADLTYASLHANAAHDFWRRLAELGQTVYAEDIGFGRPERLSGSWSSRLDRISRNADALAALARELQGDGGTARPFLPTRQLEKPPKYRLQSVSDYALGSPIDFSIEVPAASDVYIHVRPVNHAEMFSKHAMTRESDAFRARIGGEAASLKFDLIYFFTARVDGVSWLLPGLGPDLSARPYLLAQGRERSSQAEPDL